MMLVPLSQIVTDEIVYAQQVEFDKLHMAPPAQAWGHEAVSRKPKAY